MSSERFKLTEEMLASFLVELDEALESGADTSALLTTATPNILHQRMQANVECLRLLRRRWATGRLTAAVMAEARMRRLCGERACCPLPWPRHSFAGLSDCAKYGGDRQPNLDDVWPATQPAAWSDPVLAPTPINMIGP